MINYKPYSNIPTAIASLLMVILAITSCGETTAKKDTNTEEQTTRPNVPVVEELHLNMPKDNGEETRPLTQSTVALILLGDKWYSYNGTDIKSGVYCDQKQFRALLLENKKTWGDSLFVMIKPSDQSGYDDAVDALDEMEINGIKRYALVKFNPNEEKYFQVASGPKELPNTPSTPGVEKIKP